MRYFEPKFEFLTGSIGTLLQRLAVWSCLALNFPIVGCQTDASEQKKAKKGADKNQIKYAKKFTIQHYDTYKIVSVLQATADKNAASLHYILYPKKGKKPVITADSLANALYIGTPVRNIVPLSTTHIGALDALGLVQKISAVTLAAHISHPMLYEQIKAGKIPELGDPEINPEKLLSLQPDLVMSNSGSWSQQSKYRVVQESGIPVVANADWLETTPLGRAEWIKFMAVFFEEDTQAQAVFDSIATSYLSLRKLCKDLPQRPRVISSSPYKDIWYVPAGGSFMATFIEDAGGLHPWKNKPGTGSLPLSFEEVYPIGLEADFWINPGAAYSLSALATQDTRFADFKSFKSKKVYNNHKRLNAEGGNDYWQTGFIRPDWVLADLIYILHPEKLPKHQLVFFKLLE